MRNNSITQKIAGVLVSTLSMYALNIDEATNLAMKNNQEIKKMQYEYAIAKEQSIQSKAGYLPRVDIGYEYEDANKAQVGSSKQSAVAYAKVSYNLFKGFADKYTIQARDFYEQNRRLLKNAVQQDIALQTKTRFIHYLKAQKNSEIAHSSLKMLQKQYDDAKNYYKQGIVANNEVLEVQTQLLDAQQKYRTSQREIEIAKKALENSIGVPINSQIEAVAPSSFDYTLEELLSALTKRDELKALKKSQASFDSQVKANQANYMPQANISLGYNEYGKSWDFDPNAQPDSQAIASLELQWNLYAGGKDESEKKILKHKSNIALQEYSKLLSDIKLQLFSTWSEYQMSKDNLQTAKKALESARKNYKIVQKQFAQGLVKSSALIDANFLLVRAKQNLNNTQYDKEVAIYSLLRIAQKNN